MTEAAVSLKLPTFWPAQPAVWFAQAEAQFHLRNITQDGTKYYYVVAALDQPTAERIIDVLENPPNDGKYEKLKGRLLGTFGLTRQQRASRLLQISGLGDRTPSQLMDEMLALLGDHHPCLLFEELFKQQLPADIRMQLTSMDFSDPREVAKKADALWASRPQPMIATAHNNPNKPSEQSKSQTSTNSPDAWCFFHRRFGDRARKCEAPCNYRGNGRAGRQ